MSQLDFKILSRKRVIKSCFKSTKFLTNFDMRNFVQFNVSVFLNNILNKGRVTMSIRVVGISNIHEAIHSLEARKSVSIYVFLGELKHNKKCNVSTTLVKHQTLLFFKNFQQFEIIHELFNTVGRDDVNKFWFYFQCVYLSPSKNLRSNYIYGADEKANSKQKQVELKAHFLANTNKNSYSSVSVSNFLHHRWNSKFWVFHQMV